MSGFVVTDIKSDPKKVVSKNAYDNKNFVIELVRDRSDVLSYSS